MRNLHATDKAPLRGTTTCLLSLRGRVRKDAVHARRGVSNTVDSWTILLAMPMLLAARKDVRVTLGGRRRGMEIEERIRRARRIAGFSHQELARVLRVTYEWIATGRGEMRLPPGADDTPAVEGCVVVDCPHERRLLLGYRSAPARIKAVLQDLAGLHAPAPKGRERLLSLEKEP